MSMLGASDRETHSYLEIADAVRQHGAAPVEDLKQLWRRIVFSILISNTDDHLRNHAFLYEGNDGWRLSPAYDLNPVPPDLKPRILSTRSIPPKRERSRAKWDGRLRDGVRRRLAWGCAKLRSTAWLRLSTTGT